MIVVPAFLLLVAVGLLAGGLAQGSFPLEWASFAASAVAFVILIAGELGRRRRRAETVDAPGAADRPAGHPGAEPAAEPVGREVPAAVREPVHAGATAVGTATAPTVEPATGPIPVVQPAPEPAPAADPEPTPVVDDDPTPPADTAQPVMSQPQPVHPEPVQPEPVQAEPVQGTRVSRHGAPDPGSVERPLLDDDGEPPVEEVEFTDLLMIMDLTDEVLVIDEHPRYHLAGCPHLAGVATIPVAMDQARSDGFTPCGTCAPDRNLAERERSRRGEPR